MTLQERILEALAERALAPKALYQAMSGELLSAVDFALRSLLRTGEITFELGVYRRQIQVNGCAQKAEKPGSPVPVVSDPQPSPMMRCRRCKERKTLEEFDLEPGRRVRMKTCDTCLAKVRTLKREKEAVIAAGSNEGAKEEAASRGAAVEAPKLNIERRRAPTFSEGARAWLIDQQRLKAEELQWLREETARVQEELWEIEGLVRIATAKEGAG